MNIVSPLLECGESGLLEIFSFSNLQICNGAKLLAQNPFTVKMPSQQWSYGILVPLTVFLESRTGQDYIVRIKLHVEHGEIGIAGVDSSLSGLTTIEKKAKKGASTILLTIDSRTRTAAVFLRTFSFDQRCPEIQLHEVTVHRVGPARLAPRNHDLKHDLFVILSQGKTATQTIEQTLLGLNPDIQVRRTHFVSSKAVEKVLTAIDGEQQPMAWKKLQILQANFADRVREEVNVVRSLGGRIAFISGKREPIDRIVSLVFQRIPTFVPGFSQFHAVGRGLILTLKEYTIDLLYKELESHKRKDLLQEATGYYHEEVIQIANLDVMREPFDRERGYSIVADNEVTVLLYRYENIRIGLSAAIIKLTGRANVDIIGANRSYEKAYAALYEQFRLEFKVPVNLCTAIYGEDPYMRYFYSEAEIAKFQARWSE